MDTVSGSEIATAAPLPALCNILKEVGALVGCNAPRGQKLEGIRMALPRVTERKDVKLELKHSNAKSLVVCPARRHRPP